MPHADQDLQALRAIATDRGGVVAGADLELCGVSLRAAHRRVERGDSAIGWQFCSKIGTLAAGS